MPLSSVLQAFKARALRRPEVKTLQIGIVGAGRMGQLHARTVNQNPQAKLAGIVDRDLTRAQSLAKKFRTDAFPEAGALVGRIDAAILAVPTELHYSIGKFFLAQGIPCLIEKPLANQISEAEELIALATQKQCVLQVGHVERFNPAVMAAAQFIKRPQFIEVNRLGPYDPRVAGIGVVMDLMIHDLDIVMFLVGEDITRVESFGARVLSDHEDIAKVRLTFANGCIADLSASRVSLKKYRRIRIFQKNAYLSLDYAAPSLTVYRKKGPQLQSLSDIEIIKPKLSRQEPLALELEHFLQCVREGRTPLVSGPHGRDALRLAKDVLDKLQIHE